MIVAALFFLVVGLAATVWYPGRLHILERLALAYLLGVGLVTTVMFWLSIIGVSFRLDILLPVLLIGSGFSFGLAWGQGRLQTAFRIIERPGWGDVAATVILVAALVVMMIPVFQTISALPNVFGPDAIGRQGPAIAFANEGTANVSSYPLLQVGHPEYPLLTSLMLAFVWMFSGETASLTNGYFAGMFPLFYLALVVIFYFRLRAQVKPLWLALVGALVLARIPFIVLMASFFSLNMPAAAFMVAACLYLYRWWEEKQPTSALWLVGLLLGFSAWTRLEGLFLGAIPLLVAGVLAFNAKTAPRERIPWPLFVPYLILGCQWAIMRRVWWGSYGRLALITNSDLILIGLNLAVIALIIAFVFFSARFPWANFIVRRVDVLIGLSIVVVGGGTLFFLLQDRADTAARLRTLMTNLSLPEWGFLGLTLLIIPLLIRRLIQNWYLALIPLWMLLVWVVIYAWDVTGTWPDPTRFGGFIGSANRMLLNVYPLILFGVTRLLSSHQPHAQPSPESVKETAI
jgi:hypothetical protein